MVIIADILIIVVHLTLGGMFCRKEVQPRSKRLKLNDCGCFLSHDGTIHQESGV